CDLLRRSFPGCAITPDVITGFPGETEEEFAQTLSFCQEIGFARMHVFPYSARQGTPAARMPDQVPKATREERARCLIAVGNELALAYRAARVGQTVEVLCEEQEEGGLSQGYTAEYIPCEFPGGQPGQVYTVTVSGVTEDGMIGEIKP
ncbi:MAG: TRAM domain-containing protein, partial [Clostridia bacterium]|nr:TRAM domain-containing protein [Clostridia bacterium]